MSVEKYVRTIEVVGTYCGEDPPVVGGQVAQCARVELHGTVVTLYVEIQGNLLGDMSGEERARSRMLIFAEENVAA